MDTPLTPEQIAQAEKNAAHHSYVLRVLVGADQFANDLSGGKLDETISSRAQRLADGGNEFAKLITKALDDIQSQHGRKAEAGDLERAQDVGNTEKKALGET